MSEHDKGFEYVTEQWLAGVLKNIQRDTPWDDIEPEEMDADPSLDVRLQVVDGDAIVLDGDPQFDRDHRGYWGSGCITRDDDFTSLLETARDLISQARDMQADCKADVG